MMVTSSILGGIADTAAQTITSIRGRPMLKPREVSEKDMLDIELDKKIPLPKYKADLIPPPHNPGQSFDFDRLTRFMAWGFIMAPLQYRWFQFLSKTFPLTKTSATTQALKRVVCDQVLFAPLGLGLFFSFMTLAEGQRPKAIKSKLGQVYIPTMKANYIVWPFVQIINFRVMPLQFQLPFVSTVGIFWTAYISLANSTTLP